MGKGKILLIEDDWRLREATAEFLESDGYEVLTADNGSAGVELAIEQRPDLILCDISIPIFDGYEVFNILQNNPITSLIPFIFLTARTEKQDIRIGMQMGADDYITKPFDYQELVKSIAVRLKKYETIKHQNDEKLLALIDNPLIGVFIYKPPRFEFVNQKLSNILGYSINELKNLSFEDIVDEEDKKDTINKINHCIESNQKNLFIKFKAIRKDKKPIHVELSSNVIQIQGVLSLIGNIKEIICDDFTNDTIGKDIINSEQQIVEKINLSKRELEVLALVCKGLTNADIAQKLFISPRTVEGHKANLLLKTNSKNTAALILYAIKNNLVNI
jgi:PAS domain S-box-containing protein